MSRRWLSVSLGVYVLSMQTTLEKQERPRERLARVSARGLSLRELVALILGTGPRGKGSLGLASDLLQAVGNEERGLFLALETDLLQHSKISGLGVAQRGRLLAALELGRRYVIEREKNRVCAHLPSNLNRIERRALLHVDAEQRTETHEWLGFVPVLRNGRVGSLVIVARGGRSSVNVDPQELFLRILTVRPAAIILMHNHPSGDLEPSIQDHELTRAVADLCSAFGIALLSHWIVAASGSRRI